jgi:hypothetical protein
MEALDEAKQYRQRALERLRAKRREKDAARAAPEQDRLEAREKWKSSIRYKRGDHLVSFIINTTQNI